MKIGIVCYPTYGGSGAVATELGKALAQIGHEVHFISYNQPFRLGGLEANIFYHEVDVVNYPLFEYSPYELALTSKIIEVTTLHQLDILHVHYAIPHASSAYLAKKILLDKGIHLPIITTLHGTDITLVGRDKSMKPVVTFAINHSDAVTSVSESLKVDTYNYFDIKKDIHVIPNFIELETYSNQSNPCLKQIFHIHPNKKVLTHISNFRPVKRIQDVIQVFSKVHQHIDSVLLLAGDGPVRKELEDLVEQLGLQQDVLFLGKVNDIQRLLCTSDLFFLPSETESFGLSALEAMASGVPVISSNRGGLPEVNLHGKTGFTCEVGAIEQMSAYALELLQNEDLYNQFSQNAYQQAQRFDVHTIIQLYLDLYESVIND